MSNSPQFSDGDEATFKTLEFEKIGDEYYLKSPVSLSDIEYLKKGVKAVKAWRERNQKKQNPKNPKRHYLKVKIIK